MNEHPNIQKEDWRLQAITTLTKEWTSPFTGLKHPVGTPVIAISTIKFDQKLLSLKLPNTTALFLDFSYKLWQETQNILENKIFLDTKSKNVPNNTIYPKNDDDFFNLIEKRMAYIVFSYSALESFANENIPDNYILEVTRNDGKCTEKYNKEQIEKWLSLDIKLGEILPQIMNVSSPKGGPLWNKYSTIKQLRDRIIHMKSADRKSSGPEEESIWKDILNKMNPNFALEAKDIIRYYLTDNFKIPRWFNKFPYS